MAKPPIGAPWAPARYDDPDVYALKALERGDPTPEQCTRALNWIIHDLCKTFDMSYRPNSVRDSDFAEGKRFVGNQIVKLLKLNMRKDNE